MNKAEMRMIESALETKMTAELVDEKGKLTEKAIVLLTSVARALVNDAIKTIIDLQKRVKK